MSEIVFTTYAVTIEFLRDMLGTVPKDRKVFTTYIQSLGEDNDDELEAAPETVEQRGWTGFPTEKDGKPFLWDYQVKGHLKDAASALRQVEGSKSFKMTAYSKNITNLVHIEPRRIMLALPRGGVMGVLERPLRAQTMQGPRVTVVRSDTVPEGTTASFRVIVLGEKVITEAHLTEWLHYGRYNGLGQWRGAGWGSFVVHNISAITF